MSDRLANRTWGAAILLALLATVLLAVVASSLRPSPLPKPPMLHVAP